MRNILTDFLLHIILTAYCDYVKFIALVTRCVSYYYFTYFNYLHDYKMDVLYCIICMHILLYLIYLTNTLIMKYDDMA